jgi:hypothetical protein
MPKQNKFLWYVAMAIVCWGLFTATFDGAGNFDPTTETDVIEYRISSALGMVVQDANRSIDETNQGMQDVADGRDTTNRKRIRRDVAPETE